MATRPSQARFSRLFLSDGKDFGATASLRLVTPTPRTRAELRASRRGRGFLQSIPGRKLKAASNSLFSERDFLAERRLSNFFQTCADTSLPKSLCFLSEKHFNAFLILDSPLKSPARGFSRRVGKAERPAVIRLRAVGRRRREDDEVVVPNDIGLNARKAPTARSVRRAVEFDDGITDFRKVVNNLDRWRRGRP